MYTVGYGISKNEAVALKEAGLDQVYVSLEGDKRIDEAYKGVRGSYDVAVGAIKHLTQSGIQVTIHFTPTKQTYQHLPHVIAMANELKVSRIRVMAFVPQGRGWENRERNTLTAEDNQVLGRMLLRILESNPHIDFQFSGAFDHELRDQLKTNSRVSFSNCMLDKQRFVITSDGLMIPSFAVRMSQDSMYPNMLTVLGSIHDTSVREVWNASLSLRQKHSAIPEGKTAGLTCKSSTGS
jgi:MoaA/NifB/PqqE/SkfB family radical SAM enzyme